MISCQHKLTLARDISELLQLLGHRYRSCLNERQLILSIESG